MKKNLLITLSSICLLQSSLLFSRMTAAQNQAERARLDNNRRVSNSYRNNNSSSPPPQSTAMNYSRANTNPWDWQTQEEQSKQGEPSTINYNPRYK